MKRRTFVKTTASVSIAVGISPTFLYGMQQFSEDELIGKGAPVLYGDKIGLRKEAYEAFLKMKAAAKKEGIAIEVVSGYRDYFKQKSIYERKYKQYTAAGLSPEATIQKIIAYSTIPGTSRHHWGTDIDMIDGNGEKKGDVLVPEKFHGDGPYCTFKEWMDEHANDYGYYLVYTNNANRKGFKYEPWHYSYAPISVPMLKAYKKLDIKQIFRAQELMGDSYFSDDFIQSYYKEHILDINPKLL
ncbi:M15 family metallopeptidase [Leptobacterium sp. I13]|uniref:M15 family metallopeptidase n=1 Tax=Leptobacterium meishanense TaxID=3128904 RepID=UPI0030EDAE44